MALLGVDLEEVGVYKPKEEESEEEESEEEFSVWEESVTEDYESKSEEEESKQQVWEHVESEEEYSDSEAERSNGRYVVIITKKMRRIYRRLRERREWREKMMVSHMTKTTNSRFPCLQLEVL
jgi:hypothetical protein